MQIFARCCPDFLRLPVFLLTCRPESGRQIRSGAEICGAGSEYCAAGAPK